MQEWDGQEREGESIRRSGAVRGPVPPTDPTGPAGQRALPPRSLDGLLARLTVPMVVVTTAAGGERAGCLVGFHSQCGIEPLRYAVWLSKANRTYRVARAAGYAAVHFLGPDDGSLAELFGSVTGDEVDKFSRCVWTEGEGGVPLLVGCPNRFVGRRVDLVDVGADHVGLVLEPTVVHRRAWFGQLSLPDVIGMTPGHAAGDAP